MRRLFINLLLLTVLLPAVAQTKSSKRGLGWHEASQNFSEAVIGKLLPGVSWVYNWGQAPVGRPDNLGSEGGMEYVPMCWNNNFDETKLRQWLGNHPGTKYLLGFNEPNFSAQSNMTPQQAATAWPRLEAIAAEYGLKLVAPALNFTGEKVGGRTWSPYEWLDEFLRLYPQAHIDCLALHCYMNWASALNWFATEYFYADLFNPSKKDVYGKYPNIEAFLNSYKEANGHYPRMMLTEFCAWENDGTIQNVNFQIDQMTQKVQYLEKSDLVEGYAWFIGNDAATKYPYMSIFQTNSSTSSLSELGTVYVNMSAFDTEKYYGVDETIAAKDYVDASKDDQQVKLRRNTDSNSELPLQVEFTSGATATYQIDVPSDGTYTLSLRMNSTADNDIRVYVDQLKSAGKVFDGTLSSTSSQWQQQDISFQLKAGRHTIILWNGGVTSFFLNQLQLQSTTGISSISNQPCSSSEVYDLMGRKVSCRSERGSQLSGLPKGIYIVDGKKVAVK